MVTTIMKNKYCAHGYYTLTTDFPSFCLILNNVVVVGRVASTRYPKVTKNNMLLYHNVYFTAKTIILLIIINNIITAIIKRWINWYF